MIVMIAIEIGALRLLPLLHKQEDDACYTTSVCSILVIGANTEPGLYCVTTILASEFHVVRMLFSYRSGVGSIPS